MDTQREEQPGLQSEGESLNTGSAENTAANSGQEQQEEKSGHKKGGIHNNALYAASMGRSATAQVDPHNVSGLEQTGTNPGYEGPIAPGAGGSVGTGYASGQEAVNPTIRTDSDYDQARVGHSHKEDSHKEDETDQDETDRPADEAAGGL